MASSINDAYGAFYAAMQNKVLRESIERACISQLLEKKIGEVTIQHFKFNLKGEFLPPLKGSRMPAPSSRVVVTISYENCVFGEGECGSNANLMAVAFALNNSVTHAMGTIEKSLNKS